MYWALFAAIVMIVLAPAEANPTDTWVIVADPPTHCGKATAPAFCAGADLSSGASTFDVAAHGDGKKIDYSDDAARDGGGRVTLRIFKLLKPVIAAIIGPAVGIGATMTLPMDIRLASDNARIGFVFSRRGIVPEAASSFFLPVTAGLIMQALLPFFAINLAAP